MIKKKKRPKVKSLIEPELISGILRSHPRGFGFVIPDDLSKCSQDVFIPKHLTDHAVDGDHVEVVLNTFSQSEKGPEGRIVAILKRGRTHLAGTIIEINFEGEIKAYVPLLGTSKLAVVKAEKNHPLKIGDRIILRVLEWGDQKSNTLCEMSHYIGHITNPASDIKAALEEFDLLDLFPQQVLEEVKKFGLKVTPAECNGRKDLTKLPSFTIDPTTAKDFDDALSLKKDHKNHYHLTVHIADVAHYVKAHSALDKEARRRCNSTYFPGTCIPMLPEELSNHLCSLRPKVIRLTVSVLMIFDENGDLLSYDISRSYIKSAKRFSYEEAKEIIDGKKRSAYSKTLKLMIELCHLLKKKRYNRGSIDFALPELVLELDQDGQPIGMKKIEYDISHQLVEEFMLKTNEVIARHLYENKRPVVYRIHGEPASENFQEFFAFARALGFYLPDNPTSTELQTLFEEARKTPFIQQLSIGFIRSMKLAFYSPNNVGHYGLALEYYCHFTSPIRRYTDLVIQRLLFNEEEKDLNLEKIALHCSEQERISFRAETSVKLLKKLRLLDHFHRQDPQRIYKAAITRIKPYGVYFEIEDLMLEGFLHISELEDDYFVFNPQRNILKGKMTGKVHQMGEEIHVRLKSTDFIILESKWELVTSEKRTRKRRGRAPS